MAIFESFVKVVPKKAADSIPVSNLPMLLLVISEGRFNMLTNRKIKILYCITKSNWGGAGRYVFDLATGLPKDKFEVIVALGGNGILAEKLSKEKIRVIPINELERDVNIFRDWASFKALIEIFREEKPDVIHLNSSKIGIMGAIAGKIAGVKKIYFTAHGWVYKEDRCPFKKFVLKIVSWLNVLLTTKTIVISDCDYKSMKRWPFAKRKLELIPNGIKEFTPMEKEAAKKTLWKKLGLTPSSMKNKLVIGTIAELHRNKGLIFAMQAISLISEKTAKKMAFVIIGEGEERERLSAFIRNKGLEDKIFLTGFMEDASKYLSAFDVFILPSVKEGLPYVLLEAGLASLPVIASDIGGIPDIVENNVTGILVSKRNSCEIKKALVGASENMFAMEMMGRKLQEKVKTDFSFASMLNQIIWVYHK